MQKNGHSELAEEVRTSGHTIINLLNGTLTLEDAREIDKQLGQVVGGFRLTSKEKIILQAQKEGRLDKIWIPKGYQAFVKIVKGGDVRAFFTKDDQGKEVPISIKPYSLMTTKQKEAIAQYADHEMIRIMYRLFNRNNEAQRTTIKVM